MYYTYMTTTWNKQSEISDISTNVLVWDYADWVEYIITNIDNEIILVFSDTWIPVPSTVWNKQPSI